jgi:hypothetical protein
LGRNAPTARAIPEGMEASEYGPCPRFTGQQIRFLTVGNVVLVSEVLEY